jgi:anaerobic magnesium-protoporphyrin IX monomethyl ester cyclase
MKIQPIVLVTFNQVDNLGIGYISSTLLENGIEPQIIDFEKGKEEILQILKNLKPSIVGFSLIFQYHIWEFKKLINFLRQGGIDSHFTAGGYYASLRYEKLFKIIPALDSIVRFEGEYTFLDLVSHINSGKEWRKIDGIAFKNNGIITANPLRKIEKDLDKFHVPNRSPLKEYAFGKKNATLIAGRGCVNNCSFCNAREYFRQSSGPIKRLRKPENVVLEMKLLHQKNDCSVFLFEDDDFPVKTAHGSDWIEIFCRELVLKNLNNKIMWKINCRPDEIDYDSFAMMKNHGLYLVFLGLDDGTDIGLERLNKQLTVSKSLDGIKILKKLDIGFDYGFMLFQPSSTFASIIENLSFLKQICEDGYTPVTFLRLMPYFETRIEKELISEGRLKGRLGSLSYDFTDESLNYYYEFIKNCFRNWLNNSDGLANVSKWARNYISFFRFYYEVTPEVDSVSLNIKKTISESNRFLMKTLNDLIPLFESGKFNNGNYEELYIYRKNINFNHNLYKKQIYSSIKELIKLAEFQVAFRLVNF